MMRVNFIGIIIVVLALVGLWHLFSNGGKRAASIWFFLGQVGLALGALMLVGLLFGGITTRLSYEHRRAAHRAKNVAQQKARNEVAKVRFHNMCSEDNPISVDRLWDRLNRPRIPVSPVSAGRVTADQGATEEITATEPEATATAETATATKNANEPKTSRPKESLAELADKHPGKNGTTPSGHGSDTPDKEGPITEEPAAAGKQQALAIKANSDSTASTERPDWVVHPPKRVGNTYRRVVQSGPFQTVDECHHELEEKLRQAVFRRMAASGTDDPTYRNFTPATYEELGIGIDYIYHEICRDEYVENFEASFGPMVQVYLLLEFDPPIEKHLSNAWRKYQVRQRLGIVAFLASAGLLLLGVVYGLLKLDTWTRGYYSKRLLLGVPAVIIGLLMLWLARMGP